MCGGYTKYIGPTFRTPLRPGPIQGYRTGAKLADESIGEPGFQR